jgi:galactokinase
VNLIGEHTDYNGGLALPFAIAPGVTVEAAARDEGFVVHGERGWEEFLRGAVAELRAVGRAPRGAELTIRSDLPQGVGLSSSAALTVALVLALLALAGADVPDRVELARLCSRVENEWVGARTGLLDQLACLLGREGHALLIDFAALETRPVPLPLGCWRLVTVGSGERRAHAASGYNVRRTECERACVLLGVHRLRDADLVEAAALPPPLERRVRHVLRENARVLDAVAALEAGEIGALGPLLDASHASLRDDYDASTPAVERTVAALRAAGAAGARMVGGGFGGQVLALLPPGVDAPPGALEVAPSAGAREWP